MTDIEYKLGRFGVGFAEKRYETFEDAWVEFRTRLRDHTTPKWRIYREKTNDWGPERAMDSLHDRMEQIFSNAPVGHRRTVKGSKHEDPKFMLRKVEEPRPEEFSEIVRIALGQLGDEYTWGAAGSTEFDCSGLIVYCTGHATGVWLPHSAEQIRLDPRVTKFTDRSDVLPGDFVFYDASGRLQPGQADHIGICKNSDVVVDASSSADKVVQRAIDSNKVIGFGRLEI